MKKAEFEAILLDCDKLKRLCEERKACCSPKRTSMAAATRLQMLSPPSSSRNTLQTRHIPRYSPKPYSLNDIYRATGAGERKDPSEALRFLIDQYREEPSFASANRLEMAINRLGLKGAPDPETKQLIKRAIAVLAERTKDNGDSEFKGDNIAVTLFEHADFHGSQLFANFPFGGTLTGWVDLDVVDFNDKISSLILQVSSNEIGGRVFLFGDKRYVGNYIQVNAASGTETDQAFVGGFINDDTTSILIYRQFANELILPVGDFVPPGTIDALVAATPGIYSRGAPIFTWDPFPIGMDGHPNEPESMYIYLRVPIGVSVPNWFDYDAEIRFWVAPFADQNGLLQAPLNAWGAWVEGGLFTDHILDELMGKNGIPTVLGTVESLLSTVAAAANILAPFSSVYLLPGRNANVGNTDEDVTIVLQQGVPSAPGPIL